MDFNYVHWSNDLKSTVSGSSGCSSCGGSATKASTNGVGLKRVMRFRNEIEVGAFGIGGFAEYTDKRVNFIEINGGIQCELFDPAAEWGLTLSDGVSGDTKDGIFHDQTGVRIKEARLLDTAGALTTALSSARWLDVVAHSGQVSRFEVITLADQGNASDEPSATGLLAKWNFNDATATGTSIADVTGNTAHTAVYPQSPTFVSGKTGTAVNFNGTNQGVRIGNPADLNFAGAITMSAWIKPTRTTGWNTILGHGYTRTPDAQTSMEIYNGNLIVGSWPGTRPAQVPLPANASTTWTHVVATYDGVNWNVYLNGVKKASAADATGARTVNANWWIGCGDRFGDQRFFQGGIDDVQIYNRALTDAEVTAMNGGTDPDATGLLAKWGMDEGQGNTVADATGNAAHLGGLSPSQPAVVTGHTGQSGDNALRFDGNTSLNIGNPADLNFSGKITLAAWVKPETAGGYGTNNCCSILEHGYITNPNSQLFFRLQNANTDGAFYGGVWGQKTSYAGANMPTGSSQGNQWVHVAAEFDGLNWRSYVNGVLSGMAQSGQGPFPFTANWTIGGTAQLGDLRGFKGSIDDLRVYNRTLSDAEIYALGTKTQKAYGARLVSIKDPRGYGMNVAYKYNPSANTQDVQPTQESPDRLWQIATTSDAQGNTVNFTYGEQQVAGRWVISQATTSGQTVSYAYEDGLHLTKVTFPDGSQSKFTYGMGPTNQQTKVEIFDAGAEIGHEKKTAYLTNQLWMRDGADINAAKVWNQSAMMVRSIVDGNGDVAYANFLDANQRPDTTSVYEGAGRLKVLFGEWEERFYKDGWQIALTSDGRPAAVGAFESMDGSNHGETVGWNPWYSQRGVYPYQRSAKGEDVKTTYDAQNFPLTRQQWNGTAWTVIESWQYDTSHHTTRHVDVAGRVEAMTYDAQGNLLTKTVGAGAEIATRTYAYFPAGDPNQFLLKSETDANGNVTDYAYDSNHRMVTMTAPADIAGGPRAVTSYEYDANGNLAKTTDSVGRYTQFTYDVRNRVIRKDYCGVSYEETVYGAGEDANRIIASRDKDGDWTQYRYDGRGRVVKTIGGIASKDEAINLAFVPDTAYHSINETWYLPGTTQVWATRRNGEAVVYSYDYRQRQVTSTQFPGADASGNPLMLTTVSQYANAGNVYLDNKLFKSTDPYGRSTYYNYRLTDGGLIRTIKEETPGSAGTLATFGDVAALVRPAVSVQPPYTITDIELDATGHQTASIDAKGVRSETQYDSLGRAVVQIVAKGTSAEVKSETVLDKNGNTLEQRGPRFFDANDVGGYNKAKTVMTYSGRNLLLAKTEAPGMDEAGTTTFSYYLDGKQATTTLPNGNVAGATQAEKDAQTTIQMHRPLCGWALGSIDQAGNGSLTNTTVGGDVIHTIKVRNLKALTIMNDKGYIIPGFLNEVNMDVPDANTISESTTAYDTLHRPVASTLWSGPLGTVQRDDVPVWFDGQVQGGASAQAAVPTGVTGQTTLYYYSENLVASQLVKANKKKDNLAKLAKLSLASRPPVRNLFAAINGADTAQNGLTLHHPFGPDINLQPLMQKLNDAGIRPVCDGFTNASARATLSPTGEVTVQIMDGAGRPVINAKLESPAGN